MKIETLKNEKDYAEFFIDGERHTFPNLLKQKLLERKDVEFVSYVLEHPMDNKAKFVLKTKGKTPKKVLEEAVKDIDSDLEDFISKIKKVFK